jgi:hypothetical protein
MFNGLYQVLTGWLWGGTIAIVVLFLLIRRATPVAHSGNKSKIVMWTLRPIANGDRGGANHVNCGRSGLSPHPRCFE